MKENRERIKILRLSKAREKLAVLRQYLKEKIFPSKLEGRIAFMEVREQEKQVATLKSRWVIALFRNEVKRDRNRDHVQSTTTSTDEDS